MIVFNTKDIIVLAIINVNYSALSDLMDVLNVVFGLTVNEPAFNRLTASRTGWYRDLF